MVRETGTAVQPPAVAWKCLALSHWKCRLGDFSTGRGASWSRPLSSGVSGNCDYVSWSRVLVSSAPLGPRRSQVSGIQGVRGKCCKQGSGLHEDDVARETKDSVDKVVLYMAAPSWFWPSESPGAVCAPSKRCFVEGRVTTPAGRTPGLASPKQGTKVKTWVVTRALTHGEAEPGYAEHDLPPAGNGMMSWRWKSQSQRNP